MTESNTSGDSQKPQVTQRYPDEPEGRERVRWRRERALLTQVELANKAKVSLRTIFNVETKTKFRPRMDTRKRLLIALEIPLEDHYQIFGPFPRR